VRQVTGCHDNPKMHPNRFRLGSAHDSAGEAHSVSPRLSSCIRGAFF